jgi:hypothetical protein
LKPIVLLNGNEYKDHGISGFTKSSSPSFYKKKIPGVKKIDLEIMFL